MVTQACSEACNADPWKALVGGLAAIRCCPLCMVVEEGLLSDVVGQEGLLLDAGGGNLSSSIYDVTRQV